MAIVLELAMNGYANAEMDGVAKTALRLKRLTVGMILTTIMVSKLMLINVFTRMYTRVYLSIGIIQVTL